RTFDALRIRPGASGKVEAHPPRRPRDPGEKSRLGRRHEIDDELVAESPERKREAYSGGRGPGQREHAVHGRPGLCRQNPGSVHGEIDGGLGKGTTQVRQRGQGTDEIAERPPSENEDARRSFAHEPTATRRTSSRAQRSASSMARRESASPGGQASTTRSSV